LKGFESLGQLELGLLDREEEARCRAGREWATRLRLHAGSYAGG